MTFSVEHVMIEYLKRKWNHRRCNDERLLLYQATITRHKRTKPLSSARNKVILWETKNKSQIPWFHFKSKYNLDNTTHTMCTDNLCRKSATYSLPKLVDSYNVDLITFKKYVFSILCKTKCKAISFLLLGEQPITWNIKFKMF